MYLGLRGLQSGGLQSRATDFGSCNALIALVGGGDPEDTNIDVSDVEGLQSGGLQSGATDFGCRNTLIALAAGGRPEDTNTYGFCVGSLQSGAFNCEQPTLDLATYSRVLKEKYRGPIQRNVV